MYAPLLFPVHNGGTRASNPPLPYIYFLDRIARKKGMRFEMEENMYLSSIASLPRTSIATISACILEEILR